MLYHLMSFMGLGRRNSFLGRRGYFQSRKSWIDGGLGWQDASPKLERAVEQLWIQLVRLKEHFGHEPLSLLYTFVINVVALTVQFLISLPFSVNCSCLILWSLPSVPPVLNSIPLQWEVGRKHGSERKEQCAFGKLVGELNWGVPFLTHSKKPKRFSLCVYARKTEKTWRNAIRPSRLTLRS